MKKNIDFYFKQLQKNKSEKIFIKIYKLSSVRLFGIVLRILKQKEISENCLQETYIKIWNKADTYNLKKANAMTWMSVIARNTAIDYTRKRELPIEDGFELRTIQDTQLDLLATIDANNTNKHLMYCLSKINQKLKNIIFMAYFNGLTYKDIAKITNLPLSTIKTQVLRTLPILKKCLEDYHEK